MIDVGINYVTVADQKQICGDVEFNELALSKVYKITPVPGGVGPLTIAMLMSNLVKSWDLHHNQVDN